MLTQSVSPLAACSSWLIVWSILLLLLLPVLFHLLLFLFLLCIFLHLTSIRPPFLLSFLPSFLLYNGLTMTPIRKGAVMTAMAVMVGKLRLGVQLQLRPSPQRWYLCDCQTRAVWGSDIWSTTYDIWYWISSATAVRHMCSRQCSIPVFPPTKKLLSFCDPQHQPVSNTVSHSIFNAGPICLRCRPCAKPAGLLSL